MRRMGLITVIAVVIALVVAGVVWWAESDSSDEPETVTTPVVTTSPTPTPTLTPRPRVARSPVLRRDPNACPNPAVRPFVPVSAYVEGVTRSASVVPVARDANGIPGVPPLTTEGKYEFAWDAPGVMPGEKAGKVILDAHTWPDGTALGNHLLANLQIGDRLTLRAASGKGLCYVVKHRKQVPRDSAPLDRVYNTTSYPKVVIIVCSGTRLGPGNWTHRTLWFAAQVSRWPRR